MNKKVKKFIERMKWWCSIANLGYDQSNRWDIRDGGECDCSSLVIYALREAGFDTGDASYTGNLSSNLCARGWKRESVDGNLRAGDILLNDENHVGVWTGDGIAQACIDEKGAISGGVSGDQTGRETCIVPYYDYPWNCYLRYEEKEKRKKRKMEFIFQPNGEDRLMYFCAGKLYNLTNPDQVAVIQECYKKCYGEDIPMFKLGSKNAPWATRLFEIFS